jgi:hypothetical protein
MANYVLLERVQLSVSAASVTFSNIPQSGYTDLKIVVSGRNSAGTGSYNEFQLSFNGAPSGTAYTTRSLYSIGTSSGSLNGTSQPSIIPGATTSNGNTSNTFGNAEIYIANYLSSSSKSVSARSNSGSNTGTNGDIYMNETAGLWASSSPISSVVLTSSGSSFLPNSTFSIYGLAATGTSPAITPKATGGDIIQTNGTYWYHAFLSTGTFTPLTNLNAQILVVGGGGGGGGNIGAGGGAGAMTTFATTSSLSSDVPYICSIGAGGAGSTYSSDGSTGGTTSFAGAGFTTITALGGGFGSQSSAGGAGGSGGGGMSGGAGGAANGPNTNVGATGANAYPYYGAGGGGGATAAGTAGTASGSAVGGNGGQGYTISSIDSGLSSTNIFGSMTVIASGGGGSGVRPDSIGNSATGGTGGTGAGNGGYQGTIPTASTSFGSGGGGASWENYTNGDGSNGYQGLIIVRYTVA